MQLAAQACFDPSAAIKVFQKLGDYEKRTSVGSTPGFLRTHPLSDDRVKRVGVEMPSARQTYELSECGRRKVALSDVFW
jgi:predicted Zn-dependent protease